MSLAKFSSVASTLAALFVGGAFVAGCSEERPTVSPVVDTSQEPVTTAPLPVEAPAPTPAPAGMPVAEPPVVAPQPTGEIGAAPVENRAAMDTMTNLTGSPDGLPPSRSATPQQPSGWMFWIPAQTAAQQPQGQTQQGQMQAGSTLQGVPPASTIAPSQLGVPTAPLPGAGSVNVSPPPAGTVPTYGAPTLDTGTRTTIQPGTPTASGMPPGTTPPAPGAPVTPTRTTPTGTRPVFPQAPGAPSNLSTSPGQTPPGTPPPSSGAPGTPSAPGTPAPGATPSAPGTSPSAPAGTR